VCSYLEIVFILGGSTVTVLSAREMDAVVCTVDGMRPARGSRGSGSSKVHEAAARIGAAATEIFQHGDHHDRQGWNKRSKKCCHILIDDVLGGVLGVTCMLCRVIGSSQEAKV
jgi:hypothetical protein